jgi:hypothetical protein
MLHVPASRLRLRFAPLLVIPALCVLVTGCGNSSPKGKLLSQRQASDLRGTLSQVEQDVTAKDCTAASERVAALQQQIDGINRLDSNLRSSLRGSVRRLETLVTDSCQTTTTTPTQTTPTTPDTGTTGATGTTGPEGKKKAKKVKPPKEAPTPPGQGGQTPPGQKNGGGGAGVPGESNSNGNGD